MDTEKIPPSLKLSSFSIDSPNSFASLANIEAPNPSNGARSNSQSQQQLGHSVDQGIEPMPSIDSAHGGYQFPPGRSHPNLRTLARRGSSKGLEKHHSGSQGSQLETKIDSVDKTLLIRALRLNLEEPVLPATGFMEGDTPIKIPLQMIRWLKTHHLYSLFHLEE